MTAALQQKQSEAGPVYQACDTPAEQRSAAASHLAHDARNWLTVLQVYCDLLRSSGAVTGHGRTWMDELAHAVERGQGLVTSLLDSAQRSVLPESSPANMACARPKMLDLASVLPSREPLFRQLAGSAIRVEIKIAAHARTTALQEEDFDRILLNLVGNAIEAMPQGGRLMIELDYGGASQPRPLVLRVSDTGKGIPADLLPGIFVSGFSTKATAPDAEGGRGYGLAIVRKLTLAAGGSVQVRSRVGHGSCFTIELPVQAPPRPRSMQRRSAAPDSRRTAEAPSRTLPTNNFGSVRKGTRVPC